MGSGTMMPMASTPMVKDGQLLVPMFQRKAQNSLTPLQVSKPQTTGELTEWHVV